jgi:hypothetical protein
MSFRARSVRSFGLLAALSAAVATSVLVNCSSPQGDGSTGPSSEDAVTGFDNPRGLSLRFDEQSGHLQATVQQALTDGEHLVMRARRGKRTLTSQKDLQCADLTDAPALTGGGQRQLDGTVLYDGPQVDASLLQLIGLFNDVRWATDAITQDQADQAAAGPDAIVEACIVKGSEVRAKLQTSLAYAWDQGTIATNDVATQSHRMRLTDADGGFGAVQDAAPEAGTATSDAGPPAPPHRLVESDPIHSQIEYGQLCVNEMG